MSIKTTIQLFLLYTLVPISAWAGNESQIETMVKLRPELAPLKANSELAKKIRESTFQPLLTSPAVPPSSPLLFELNTNKTLKEMGLQRKYLGGGGVVDGGGGNYGNNQLLDRYQSEDLSILSRPLLVDLIERNYGPKISAWEQTSSGLRNWLMEALELNWHLTSKPIDATKCLNLSSQGAIICFNFNSIIINQTAFQKMVEPQQAKVILSALVSYHMHLRNPTDNAATLQKRNTHIENLLQSASPSELIQGLQKVNALPTAEENEIFRESALTSILNRLQLTFTALEKAPAIYKDLPASMRRGCNQFNVLAEKDIRLCLQLSAGVENSADTCGAQRFKKLAEQISAACGVQ